MVCSACGHESPSGNRFCGMCGTPLPHLPLSTPGAQGTIDLTRVPREGPVSDQRESAEAAEAHGPGETPEPLEASAVLDELATTSEEPSPRVEVLDFPWMEDVLGQIAVLEAAKSSERPAEGDSPFPDLLDELPASATEPDEHTSTVATPSFLEMSDAPQTTARSDATTEVGVVGPSSAKWRMWIATAAVLVFAVLGSIQWRSHRNHSNGVVKIIREKIGNLKPSNPTDTNNRDSGTGSPEGKASGPATRVEEQPKPQGQGASATPPSAPNASSRATSKAVSSTVASQDQSPPPTGSNPAMTQPIRSVDKAQPSGQSSGAASQLANASNSKMVIPPTATQPAPTAAAKPKATNSPTRDEDQQVAKKIPPGALELNKAKNASDTAAEAAWLWKATAKGNPDAPVRLADMYIKGDGVPRSCEQAVVLLKTAAIKDNARACNRLASLFATGTCVQRNHVQAYRWLSSALAADPKSQWAQQNRDLTWQQMTPEERALAQKHP